MGRGAAVQLLIVPLLLAGVAATEPSVDAVDPGDVVPGLELAVVFPRHLQVDGERVAVAITNGSEEPLQVEGLAIRAAGFEELPREPKSFRVRPGGRTTSYIDLAPVICDRELGDTAVEIALTHGDLQWEGTVLAEDAQLRRFHTAQCAAAAISSIVHLRFDDTYERGGDVLHTRLVAELRDSSEAVQVDAIRGSVILTIAADDVDEGEPLLIVDADQPAAEVDVAITASRCEPHAVIESKKTFEFGAWVTTGDYEEQRIVIEPTGAVRAELQTMIDDCLERHVGA